MKNNSKKLGIIILILTFAAFAVFLIFAILSGTTKKNPDDATGSKVGNIYNRGLFCEYDGYIYFSNPADDGTLYRMTSDCNNIKKIYTDKVRYINADEHYLYYTRVNNLLESGGSFLPAYDTGVFRINRTGNANLKCLVNKPAAAILLYGNNIYYQQRVESKGLSFHRVGIDGSNDIELTTDPLFPSSIYDGYLFASNVEANRNLCRYTLPDLEMTTVVEGMTYFPIAVKTGIYFINVDTYQICRTDYTGEVKVLIDKPCCTYNISEDGRFLFYQVDRTKSNYIGVLNLETNENRLILEGDYHYLNITSKYLFFSTLDNETTYAYSTDGSGKLQILNLKK